jgi:GcrA cell cycle regulator
MNRSIGLRRGLHRHPNSPWTEERVELLKLRSSQGASGREIARELDCGISRTAVLAKMHRLGIVKQSRPFAARERRLADKTSPGRPESRTRHRLGHAGARWIAPTWIADTEPHVDNPLLDSDIPPSQRCSLLELESRSCRWPVGDPGKPDFFFCGAEALPNKPYCGAHCARAYRPAEQASQRAQSARVRRALLRYRGVDTYIRFGGETAAECRWAEGGR